MATIRGYALVSTTRRGQDQPRPCCEPCSDWVFVTSALWRVCFIFSVCLMESSAGNVHASRAAHSSSKRAVWVTANALHQYATMGRIVCRRWWKRRTLPGVSATTGRYISVSSRRRAPSRRTCLRGRGSAPGSSTDAGRRARPTLVSARLAPDRHVPPTGPLVRRSPCRGRLRPLPRRAILPSRLLIAVKGHLKSTEGAIP